MSSEPDSQTGSAPIGDDVERIADPDNYNLRQWLRQLHEAKERVRETARDARHDAESDGTNGYTERGRNRLIAEDVADLVVTLRALVRVRDESDADSFLNTQVAEIDGVAISLGDVARNRGQIPGTTDPLPYAASMEAWARCTEQLAELTAPEFDATAAPADNPVDPAGRLESTDE